MLAQLVEQVTLNHRVVGSIPTQPTLSIFLLIRWILREAEEELMNRFSQVGGNSNFSVSNKSVFTTLLTFVLLTFPLSNAAQAWLLEEIKDDFGVNTLVLSTFFDQVDRVTIPNEAPTSSRYAALGIRCQESESLIAIAFSRSNSWVKLFKKKSVDLRFDNGTVISWPATINGDFIYLSKYSELIKRIKIAKNIAVRATDSNGKYLTANFDVSRLTTFSTTFRKFGCKLS